MFSATNDRNESQPSTSSYSIELSQPCRLFQFHEILLATNDFDESLVIGKGGFGNVYKGNIINGSTVFVAAIKRLDPESSQGASEFWAEVEMLSNFRHCHVVPLFGYCNHEKEMILIYEYMHNGTLEDHLHKLHTPLSWLQRLKICIGATRGLDYLHTGTGITVGVIHRDVKSSNILLDESWAAKISDFGLSKVGPTNLSSSNVNTIVKGTFGYLDPDYAFTGMLTRKSDVYSFGVVLLEVLCRKRALDRSRGEEQQNLARWAQESIKGGNLKHIIDSGIRGEILSKCLKKFVRITETCLLINPKQRPTMAEVVVSLTSVLTLQGKTNISLQTGGKTIFGKMFDMFPSPSNQENSGISSSQAKEDPEVHLHQLKRFSFRELQVATGTFSDKNILGRGGFGTVYKGRLADGSFASVKRWKEERPGGKLPFETEVAMISMAVHRNILRLRGLCMTPTEWLLVYPYMANGSVASCLRERQPNEPPLDWPMRKRIALGSARGLSYLHDHCHPKIIHGNVKGANILLDDEFEAVVGDFALAKLMDDKDTHVMTAVRGTIGHIAPEYLSTGKSSEKTDVYGYGIVLLELNMGQRAFDSAHYANDDDVMLFNWVSGLLKEQKLEMLVDPSLEGNYVDSEVEELIQMALLCTQDSPMDRPKMSDIIGMLEGGGLAERWDEWQKEEIQENSSIYYPKYNLFFDSTENAFDRSLELSGGR